MHAKVIKLDSVESTNIWARKHLAELNDFDVVSADIQSKGHGQFDRKWFSSSSNGGNIYISIVLKPDNIEHLNELTRFSAVIISDILEKDYKLEPNFKFPNDILIDGKKISGILAESVFLGSEFKGVIVGIGINLNLDEEELSNIDVPATSIFNETKKNVQKDEFLISFMEHFENCYDKFLEFGLEQELSYIK